MLAELHARWEREDEMARKMKVCTITTSNDVVPNASSSLTLIGVEQSPTPCAKKPKTAKTFSTKSAEIFRSMGDDSSISFNDFDVGGCNISEVILFFVMGMTTRVGQGQSPLLADVPGISTTLGQKGWLRPKGQQRQQPASGSAAGSPSQRR
jgi:hypothetical protein